MNNLMDTLEGGALTMPARDSANVLKKRRRTGQFIMGAIFLVILIGGWFNPLFGYFIPLCMVFGIGIGLFRGRKWCDWYCPRGSFYDSIMAPVSPKKKIPPFFKGLPLRIGMLSFLMVMMTVQIIMRWPDPYNIGRFFVMLITVTTAVGIILSFVSSTGHGVISALSVQWQTGQGKTNTRCKLTLKNVLSAKAVRRSAQCRYSLILIKLMGHRQ